MRQVHYLIGSQHSFNRVCRQKSIPLDDPFTIRIDTLELLKTIAGGGYVVFLSDWETLPEGRAMYNHVIGERAAGMLVTNGLIP